MQDYESLDRRVRACVYDIALQRGYPPKMAETAEILNIPVENVYGAFERLASGRVLVLQPESGEILMANPFSAVPTPFVVETGLYSCYGNCIWDALGVVAMLQTDARIHTSCADCGSAAELSIVSGKVSGDLGVIHFAIPARLWWQDIVFT